MKILKILLIIFLFLTTNLVSAQTKDSEYYEKLDKAFEIYGSIFKILTKKYVVEIDPETLMEQGVQGMLDALDPYTEYLSNDGTETDLELLMKNSYTGFGISAGNIDSMLTVLDILQTSPNINSGLRVGDKLYKIDTTEILYGGNSKLHKFSEGKPGSTVQMQVIRDGIKDTLNITLVRQNIVLKDIPYYKVFEDSIAYIKINTFSKNLNDEFKSVFADINQHHNLKGIIIDVSDNPGGLLMSAVNVCDFFVPKGTEIVTTRGRNPNDDYTIENEESPEDTLIPLAVIINDGSASASEILAGALQDLDRAVIIGQRSYGKGLVQSVMELPYNGYFKYTSAKYYIPSGRCIQKLDYPIAKDEGGLGLHHDSVFYTKNKRPVSESVGIKPDIVVKRDTLDSYLQMLFEKNYFFKFANLYTSKLDSLPIDFVPNDTTISDFKTFLKEHNALSDNNIILNLKKIKKEAENYSLNKKIIRDLDNLIKEFSNLEDYKFKNNINFIKEYLRREILHRFYTKNEIIRYEIQNNESVKKARKVLKSKDYFSILGENNNLINN